MIDPSAAEAVNRTRCPQCGDEISPTFFATPDIENHWIEFSCHKCDIKKLKSKANRLFRVWQLSGLSDDEATRLIEPKGAADSIRGWFDDSAEMYPRIGQALFSVSDIVLDDSLFGKAIGTLIAVGKRTRGVEQPKSNVIPFQSKKKATT